MTQAWEKTKRSVVFFLFNISHQIVILHMVKTDNLITSTQNNKLNHVHILMDEYKHEFFYT